MMTVRFFSGASLFALLIVDICCLPTNKGGYTNPAPNFSSKQGAPVSRFSPGVAVPNEAPKVVSTSSQPAPQPSFSQSAVQSSTQPLVVLQSGPREFDWVVDPLAPGEERASRTSAVAFSGPEYVSPPIPPPEPMYHAGELSQYESTFEHGDYQTETEEQGYLPPPLPPMQPESVAEQGYTSPPEPQVVYWGPYPHYYDYMFLRGLYPPGTVTHSSSSYEEGHDDWHDAHYERYYYPSNAAPAQQMDTDFQVPQTFDFPSQPVKQPSGNYRQPTYQAGGKFPHY